MRSAPSCDKARGTEGCSFDEAAAVEVSLHDVSLPWFGFPRRQAAAARRCGLGLTAAYSNRAKQTSPSLGGFSSRRSDAVRARQVVERCGTMCARGARADVRGLLSVRGGRCGSVGFVLKDMKREHVLAALAYGFFLAVTSVTLWGGLSSVLAGSGKPGFSRA